MRRALLSALSLVASAPQNIFFAGFDKMDAQQRANPGRLKRAQGAKYPGNVIRALTAERGCGCPYNKRRRAAEKGGRS